MNNKTQYFRRFLKLTTDSLAVTNMLKICKRTTSKW